MTNTEPLLHAPTLAHGMRARAAEAILNHEDRIYMMRMMKQENRHPGLVDSKKPAWGYILSDILYMRQK